MGGDCTGAPVPGEPEPPRERAHRAQALRKNGQSNLWSTDFYVSLKHDPHDPLTPVLLQVAHIRVNFGGPMVSILASSSDEMHSVIWYDVWEVTEGTQGSAWNTVSSCTDACHPHKLETSILSQYTVWVFYSNGILWECRGFKGLGARLWASIPASDESHG